MLRLTSRTMTQLTIQRLLTTKFILDLPTMAISLVLDVKVLSLIMDAIRRALLPLRDALRAIALVLAGLAGPGFRDLHWGLGSESAEA